MSARSLEAGPLEAEICIVVSGCGLISGVAVPEEEDKSSSGAKFSGGAMVAEALPGTPLSPKWSDSAFGANGLDFGELGLIPLLALVLFVTRCMLSLRV